MSSNNNIFAFWSWLEDNLGRIRTVLLDPSHPDREYVVSSLDQHILAIGTFTWDIEKGMHRPWSLTISPNGDPDLLEQTKAIVEQAPDLADWEFYPAHQPKKQDFAFTVYDEEMNQQSVDANPWHYVLIPAGGRQHTLLIEAGNCPHLDDNTLYAAVNHLVTCLLGEETKIHRIADIEIVDELDEEHHKAAKPIVQLGLGVSE